MSDRLADLQRQRALAQEQVAWFDREIARETGQAPAVSGPPAAPAAIAVTASPGGADFAAKDAAVAQEAEDIIAQYQQSPGDAAQNARKGCYVWFAFAMLTVVLGGAAIYFLYR